MSQRSDIPGCSLWSFLRFFFSSWLFTITLVTAVFIDQFSKLLIRSTLTLGERIPVVDGYFNIVHTMNKGIAFGLFSSNNHPYKLLLLSLSALVAVIVFAWLASQYGGRKRSVALAVALLIGGTFGNLIDRLSYGAVIDFLDLHYKHHYHWPAFNVADAAVSIATLIILVRIFKVGFLPSARPTACSSQSFEPTPEQESTE